MAQSTTNLIISEVSSEVLMKEEKIMFYDYILKSKNYSKHYTGITVDLKKRFQDHNYGKSPYTAKYKPYTMSWYCGFSDKNRAYQFEKYLKSGSGIAFLKKHLL